MVTKWVYIKRYMLSLQLFIAVVDTAAREARKGDIWKYQKCGTWREGMEKKRIVSEPGEN